MTEIEITHWQGLYDIIENVLQAHTNDFSDGIQFRGQSDYDWKITSSISRIVKGNSTSEKYAEYYEKQSQMEFMGQANLHDSKMQFDNSVNPASFLIDMQHYSCPTRLVDWTLSPYVALYFAVSENLDKDGALYSFNSWKYSENLKNNFPDIKKPKTQDLLDYKDFDIIEIIYATKKNLRLVRQQGCFHISNNILSDHESIISKSIKTKSEFDGLTKIRIPKEFKVEFLARLKTMNITAESLFPGLDGLGKSLRDMMLIRKWKSSYRTLPNNE